MVEAQLETLKPSEVLMALPHYRRSHLKSGTFHTLVRILSHCSNECILPGTNGNHAASQEIQNHDNGVDRLRQESQGKEPENLKFSGTDLMNPKHPVSHKGKQVHESSDCREFMMGVEEDVGSTGRQDMLICERESVEALSMGTNGLNKEQKIIDELNQIVKGTENLVDNGSIPLNLGSGVNQNGSSEVDLMDYQVEYVEFRGSDINPSGTESELYKEGEFNQNISEGFDASLIAKGEFEKEEHGQKVHVATHLSLDDAMKYSEQLNLSIELERLQKEMELVKPVSAAVVSLPTTEEGKFEKEEQHGQKVFQAMQFSVDQV